MVQSQLHPSGIVSEPVLEAYRTVKREDFVPRDKGAICYTDETIDLGNGSFLLEPLIHGLLTEHLHITAMDKVLIVGDATGYSKAIIGQLTAHVFNAPDVNGAKDNAPYDAIMVVGAVHEIPQTLVAQLNHGGRMSVVLLPANAKMGQVVMAAKQANGDVSTRVIKDAISPYVTGGSAPAAFVF